MFADRLGLSVSDQIRVGLAITEVARNILLHAGQGEVRINSIQDGGDRVSIVVLARDEGPGIGDVAAALRDGFSTSGGLGMGLSGARRLMDGFEVFSELGQGTTIKMCKWGVEWNTG